ncbi:sugar transferase [Algoriphagus sp. A40]|uniref:sugar transferase n=1 Tax=Algoriphagus sp. A40 TaxID=1945863 RepID=UPI000985A969|nr:sugar transferase [Algoriphagus sp. A40]OOG72741.1 lipid carrier--UDP-N-acetylgalactosaminyltransferase [Algoriphagus sp. A40]
MNYPNFWKRVLDLVLSVLLFLLLSPVFLILYFILRIHFKSSPFFLQVRPGKNGEPFQIMKFKTMLDKSELDGHHNSDEKRITTLGKLIRKSSLDEIPQLLNVLKGDMSLVGPRPLLPEYLPLYNPEQARRHNIKPGVTGWAQINGRNAISWEQKFEYDVWYVNHLSLGLDLRILFQTLWNVLRGKGVSQHGHVSAGRFTGSGDLARENVAEF